MADRLIPEGVLLGGLGILAFVSHLIFPFVSATFPWSQSHSPLALWCLIGAYLVFKALMLASGPDSQMYLLHFLFALVRIQKHPFLEIYNLFLLYIFLVSGPMFYSVFKCFSSEHCVN